MSISPATPEKIEETLELLWLRVRQRGDLPGFAKVVNAITRAMRGEEDRQFCMTRIVLSDPALTQRVLRLANSAMYSAFGRKINTVSKAVMVLGIESIGHLAIGLKLIEDLSAASAGAPGARDEMEKAVFAGHIGRQLAASAGHDNIEEAVVCAILHSLGRMMTVFYLPDLWLEVQTHIAQAISDEATATQAVLGLQLDELGRLTAQHWGLPESLTGSIQDIPPESSQGLLDRSAWLAALSTMSSGCAQILCNDSPSASIALTQIADGYAGMLGIEAPQILAAVKTAHQHAHKEALFADTGTLRKRTKTAEASRHRGKPANATLRLATGVADLRGIATAASSTQMLAMALEIIYRSLGFSRAISFLRNADRTQYCAGLCFGEDVQEKRARLKFSTAYQPDAFHVALAHDKIIFVENAKAPNFANKLPQWWKQTLPGARSFIILPLRAHHQPVGFIYADWDETLAPHRIDPAEIQTLGALRALVGLAMENTGTKQTSVAAAVKA
ncbi:MAG: HDOD domain-containing protein [Oxalobacteraceae bacterium]